MTDQQIAELLREISELKARVKALENRNRDQRWPGRK